MLLCFRQAAGAASLGCHDAATPNENPKTLAGGLRTFQEGMGTAAGMVTVGKTPSGRQSEATRKPTCLEGG